MKLIVKLLIIWVFLFCQILVFAQFNTLTRTRVKPTEILIDNQDTQKEPTVKKQREKKKSIISKIFNISTKADLKKEIDSLKILMLRYSLSKIEEKNLNSAKNKDSLFQRTGKREIGRASCRERV